MRKVALRKDLNYLNEEHFMTTTPLDDTVFVGRMVIDDP